MCPSVFRLILMSYLILMMGSALAEEAVAPPMGPPAGMRGAMPPPMPMRPDVGRPSRGAFGQVQMRQSQTESAYLLEIALGGLDPSTVQVRPQGRSLLVRVRTEMRRSRSEQFDDGRGFREVRSFSTGSRVRRLRVPPDGDLAGLQREEVDGMVRISIPRQRHVPGVPGVPGR